ncbi:HAD family phosphatase [Candidatus Poribacteria bacterium]|nr:HAD family phosphatase [Candidatus Poribacteria bacterium]
MRALKLPALDHPIRMVACDMDGTLLNRSFVLSDASRKRLPELAERDVRLVMASGRMVSGQRPFHEQLALTTPIIAYNGALVWDVAEERAIAHTPVPYDLAREAVKIAADEGLHLQYFWDDRFWTIERNSWMELYEGRTRLTGHVVDDLADFGPNKAPTKMIVITDPEQALELVDRFRAMFGERLYVTTTMPEYVELMHPDVSKGRALGQVADMYDIPMAEVMAFGDAANDASMLAAAGVSVAMENAHAELKDLADHVTLSNRDDGIVRALDAWGLLAPPN